MVRNFEYLLWDPGVHHAAVALRAQRRELVVCLRKVADVRERAMLHAHAEGMPAWFERLRWYPEMRRAAVTLFAKRQQVAAYLREQGIPRVVVTDIPESVLSTALLVLFADDVPGQGSSIARDVVGWSVDISCITGVFVDVLPAQSLPEDRRADYNDLFVIAATPGETP